MNPCIVSPDNFEPPLSSCVFSRASNYLDSPETLHIVQLSRAVHLQVYVSRPVTSGNEVRLALRSAKNGTPSENGIAAIQIQSTFFTLCLMHTQAFLNANNSLISLISQWI